LLSFSLPDKTLDESPSVAVFQKLQQVETQISNAGIAGSVVSTYPVESPRGALGRAGADGEDPRVDFQASLADNTHVVGQFVGGLAPTRLFVGALACPEWFGMFRIGLSMYLVLATMAGPSFCCCMPASLANILPLTSDKPAQGAQRKSCCHHESPLESRHEKTPARDHGKQGCPDCPSCPCQQSVDTALPSQDTEQTNQILAHSFLNAQVGFGSATALTCRLSQVLDLCAWGQRGTLPFLSAHDLLATLHILRC
jgi:hypothetical protein